MKYTLIFVLSFFSISLFSQNNGFKIKKITIHGSGEVDMVTGLNYEYFVDQIPSDASYLLKGVEFADADLDAMLCENPSIGLEFALVHSKFENIEWRNNINYIKDRIDAVRYVNHNYTVKQYSTISFVNYHDELSIESSLVYDASLGPLHFYGGAGTNFGISLNDEVRIKGQLAQRPMEATDDSATTEQLMNQGGEIYINTDIPYILTQRLFVQGGMGLALNKLEFGLEYKKGIGYRTIGTGMRVTKLTGIQLRLGWRL